jgi:hypothetical protein
VARLHFIQSGGIDSPIVLRIANTCERSMVIDHLTLYVTSHRRLWLIPARASKYIHYKLRHQRLFFRTGGFNNGWLLDSPFPLPTELSPGHSLTIQINKRKLFEYLGRGEPPLDKCWLFFSARDAVGNEHDSSFLWIDLNEKEYPVWWPDT